MSKRFTIAGIVGTVVAVVLGASIGLRRDDQAANWVDSESDPGAAANLDELVAWSSVIATGEYVGETVENVDLSSPVDGKVYSRRVDRVMRFKPTSVLKTDREVRDELLVRSAVSLMTWEASPDAARTQEFGVIPLERGRVYALFLTRFSESTGDDLGLAGPIAIADVDGERLHFLAPDALLESEAPEPPLLSSRPNINELPAAIANPKPTVAPPKLDPNSPAAVYGERLTMLADGLHVAGSRAEVDLLLNHLGLGPGQVNDRTVCRKVEAALDASGWATDLGCP